MESLNPRFNPRPSAIRLGFVPLSDCAPIAVAQETGIFERHGLRVELSRELGWATVRDKMFYGHLDASQSIAGLAFALGLGLTGLKCEVAVPMVLNLHGNAITLSREISPEKIGRGEGLRSFLTHSWKKDRPLTLAATHRCSSHHILLHSWLKRNGIDPSEDAEIIFLPPPLMPRQLKAGHIDGYCVGEPWNSESILSGIGWSPATSTDLSHGHPEKVLLLSGNFLRENYDESLLLVTALLEACALCQDPYFRPELIKILSKKEYTGASPQVLENSLGSMFDSGIGSTNASHFHLFSGDSVNRPTVDKASWILAGLRATGAFSETTSGSISRIYREDLYHAATHQMKTA
ncbi:MAG TPA: CmpA/NrtA family ABC transporter substrate-binding protein [Luteolibacter sp.]|nr:CmpA/NrtA family ABC transporter substrate-binding protein [Luteolibacter sp.]